MIDVIRFDHISMAVPALEPQIEILERLFGFRYAGKFVEEREGYIGAIFEIPGSSDLGWEVLEPYGEDSYLHRFLEGVNGPGLHHVAVQIRDLEQARAALLAEGVQPWGASEPVPAEDAAPAEAAEVAIEGNAAAPTPAPEPPFTEDVPASLAPPASPASPTPPITPEAPAQVGQPSVETPRPDGDEHAARGTIYIHPRAGGHGFLYQLFAGPAWHRAEPFTDDREHTLGIIAVNHLSHAHPSRDELGSWYERVFGLETFHRSPATVDGEDGAPGPGFSTQVLETPTRQLRWEILEPAGPDSFVQQFIDRRGPAMHHIAFEVGDWDRAIAACEHNDVSTFGERSGETNGVPWREAFIHPRDTGGVLTQFFWQAQPNVWI